MMAQEFAKIPGLDAAGRAYSVQRPGYEAIRQSLYDFQTYAAAGQTSLNFFQVPQGQSSKTIADTNMEVAGSLPQGKQFLVTGISIDFFPGVLPGTHVTTIAETEFTNDVYTLAKSGSLDFFITSKSYLQEAPLAKFPSRNRLAVDAGHALHYTQAAAADAEEQVSTDYASMAGRPYAVDPGILLVSNTNFSVKLEWPSVVALPSGQNGRIGVNLHGILYRKIQ